MINVARLPISSGAPYFLVGMGGYCSWTSISL